VIAARPAAGADADEEIALVEASKRGEAVAFNRLVLRWEKPIYNLSLRMLADPEEAADATQEVFLSAYRNIGRFRRDARFSTWLYRIAVNRCVTRMRRRPPGVHFSLDRDPGGPVGSAALQRESHEQALLDSEARSRVRRALEHLPSEQRSVVELKFFEERTFDEIARIVEAPLSTVKSRLYAGLELLKSRLGRE
jgi:RNA polymerase sigma-70 factor (ECF subfamily)